MDDSNPTHASSREIGGAPRWVKALAVGAFVVIALIAVLLLVGGDHGPGQHLPSDDGTGHTAPAGDHKP